MGDKFKILAFRRKTMSTELSNNYVNINKSLAQKNLASDYILGFDRILNELSKVSEQKFQSYPPHNVIKLGEYDYLIELAVAGFSLDELEVVQEDRKLSVSGTKNQNEPIIDYLYKGIGKRDFVKTFTLADTIEIGEVTSNNGLLSINLKNVIPESKLPRKITIK